MKAQTSSTAEMIRRYTDQPARMPLDLRRRIEELWQGEPIQLYAMADLDESMRFTCRWVAVGATQAAIVDQYDHECGGKITSFALRRIKDIWETQGLSCTTLTLSAEGDEPALAVLRYTHRQRKAMENVKFLLQQKHNGRHAGLDEPDEMYAESIAEPIKKAQASVAVHRLKVIWRLLCYLKPYQGRLAAGMIAASLVTVVSLFPPYLTGFLIDRVIKPVQSGSLSIKGVGQIVWLVIAAIAAVSVLRELFEWIRLRTMAVLGEYVARDLRRELYEHLQELSLSYFSSKQTGSIITRVSSDTDRLWHFIAFGIVEASLSVIMLAGLGAVLIGMDWRLGLIMTVPVPLMLWALFAHSMRMQKIFLRAWRKWSSVTAVLGDTIPGIRVVKAFHQEDYEKGRFNSRNYAATDEFNRIHITWTKFWPVLMLGLQATVIAVWVFAIPRVMGGGGGEGASLSAGKFISFLLYMGMFMSPIEMIGQAVQMMNRATSSAHRIFEILDTEPAVADLVNPVRLSPLEGHITFENVTFAYDSIRPVLKEVCFDVSPGEMIGLVGPSGAGKTTIINLIARFYDVTMGRVLIDGVDVRELDIGQYRTQVGMVMQDAFLFHGTILDNIRYGRQDATIEGVIEASRAANAHDFICKLPNGYDTMVGERGLTLSGGERQRISIARAILNNPRILLLDEATSSVDTETERKIQEALNRVISGRTVLAIAHRLSTLNRASRLLVIEDGQITEMGTHKELLSNPEGTYAKLCRMQRELHKMYTV